MNITNFPKCTLCKKNEARGQFLNVLVCISCGDKIKKMFETADVAKRDWNCYGSKNRS